MKVFALWTLKTSIMSSGLLLSTCCCCRTCEGPQCTANRS